MVKGNRLGQPKDDEVWAPETLPVPKGLTPRTTHPEGDGSAIVKRQPILTDAGQEISEEAFEVRVDEMMDKQGGVGELPLRHAMVTLRKHMPMYGACVAMMAMVMRPKRLAKLLGVSVSVIRYHFAQAKKHIPNLTELRKALAHDIIYNKILETAFDFHPEMIVDEDKKANAMAKMASVIAHLERSTEEKKEKEEEFDINEIIETQTSVKGDTTIKRVTKRKVRSKDITDVVDVDGEIDLVADDEGDDE